MKRNDIIYAIICGLAVAWVASDFLKKYALVFFIVLPVLSVVGLLLCDIIGRKYLFVHQAGKFALAGAFADVIDIKAFQFFFLLIPIPLFLKTISFIIATLVKYIADKYWAFSAQGGPASGWEKLGGEVVKFFMVALVGLLINVTAFYCATEIIKPQFGISIYLWEEASIIFAALVTALWNFLGYKFIVFKK